MKLKFLVFLLLGLLSFTSLSDTKTKTAQDNTCVGRSCFPDFLKGVTLGLDLGAMNADYTSSDLNPRIPITHIDTTVPAFKALLTVPVWKQIDASLSLIKGSPLKCDVTGGSSQDCLRSVALNFGLRYKIPLHSRLIPYLGAGVGMIIRRNFSIHGFDTIDEGNFFVVPLTAGLQYLFSRHWLVDLNFTYLTPNKSHHVPSTYFAGLGVAYKLLPSEKIENNIDGTTKKQYYFPLNTVGIGGLNSSIFNFIPNPHITAPPIYWRGTLTARSGFILWYERNIYHSQKYFSFNWGADLANWTTTLNDNFYTVSLYLNIKVWLVKAEKVDLYLTWTNAGLTYMSKKIINGRDVGGHFTFQDFLGIGALFGEAKAIGVELKFFHYSNGSLFPQNPGIDTPLIVGITYNFD